MIADTLVIAACAFGAAAFCFASGLVVGSTAKKSGTATFPVTHASFDLELSDDDRLRFLAEAAQAVRDGRLRQPKNLGDDAASDQKE